MVKSIQFWLKAFYLLDDESVLTDFTKSIFNPNPSSSDPYLEKTGTSWLLHYKLCSTKYASIYNLVFREYFHDRAIDTFSKSQLANFLKRKASEADVTVNDKTLHNDINVFLKSYLLPAKGTKSFEDDFSALFIELGLIKEIPRSLNSTEELYRIQREIREDIPEEIFLFAVLNEMTNLNEDVSAFSFDDLNEKIGSIFCLSIEGLEIMVERVCEKFPKYVVYKSDSGVKELQVKVSLEPITMIEEYYAKH